MNETQATTTEALPTYLNRGDPHGVFSKYAPTWIHRLAADVTLEGSILDGAVQGADAVRTVIGAARQLYDRQDFNFVGRRGDNVLVEDYTADVRGVPVGAVHSITFNDRDEVQNIVVNYRPLSGVMTFSRLLYNALSGTPYASHYLSDSGSTS